MAADTYWVRVGVRVDGPFTVKELRARAKSGALPRVALVSQDKASWKIASHVRALFNADGTVCTTAVVEEIAEAAEEFEWDSQAEPASPPLFAVALPTGGSVRAEWVLAPAWAATLVASLLPVLRVPGEGLCAWELMRIAGADGWRGVVVALAWLVLGIASLTGIICACALVGARRGSANLVVASIALACAMIGFACGAARGGVSVLCLPIAAFSAALVVMVVQSPTRGLRGGQDEIVPTAVASALAVLGIVAVLASFAALFVKGWAFAVAGTFVVVAGSAIAIAGVLAGYESPNRKATLTLAIVALVGSVFALLAEGITVTVIGGPRMAAFDAVRAICVVAMACIGAYLGARESSWNRAPSTPAPPLPPTPAPSTALEEIPYADYDA